MASSRSDSLRSSAVSHLARFKQNVFHIYNNTLTPEQLGRATSKNTYRIRSSAGEFVHCSRLGTFIGACNVFCTVLVALVAFVLIFFFFFNVKQTQYCCF